MKSANHESHESLDVEQWYKLLSQMRSNALFLARSVGRFEPEQGVAFAKLLAGFAALGVDIEGEDLNESKYS